MKTKQSKNNRRNFIKSTNIHAFGKRKGYTNEVSILVSMMDWMRDTVLRGVKNVSQKELDFLLDDDANSIGAMLMHLAATERYYQINTFTGIDTANLSFGLSDDMWEAASNLGDSGRKMFKGKSPSFYLDKIAEVREFSLKFVL